MWWQTQAACLVSPDIAKTFMTTTTWQPPASAGITHITPHSAVSPDGWIFTEERGSGFNGASMWNVTTNEHVRIRKFANPQTYQAAGGFNGRYVLWQETHNLETFDDFHMYIYDLAKGKQRDLGPNGTDADGNPYFSPLDPPEVQDGYGMWVMGSGKDRRDVKVVDLASGQVRTLVSGAINGAHLDEGVVTVTYADRRHEQFDVTSGSKVTQPWVHEFDGLSMVTFGADWAAAVDEQTGNDLWFKRSPDAPTELILHLDGDHSFQNAPQRDGRFLVYPDDGHGAFALDLTTSILFQVADPLLSFENGNEFVSIPRSEDKAAPTTKFILRTVDPDKLTPDLCPDPQPAPTPTTDGAGISQA